jgi:hypothetical protein
MISELKVFFADPLVASLTGLVTFAASTALAVYFYIKARLVSRLDYASYDVQILSKRFPNLAADLEILHKGIPVPEVTGTVAAVWNSGNQTIHESQIVEGDRLRFEVPEGKKILKAHLVATARSVNGARVTIDKAERYLWIEFGYLDAGDGFIMIITHTAAPRQCTIGGTLQGVRQGPRLQRVSRLTRLIAPMATTGTMLVCIYLLSFAGVALGTWATFSILIFVTVVPAFAPDLLVSQRARSFPKELRENPNAKGLLPFLLHGDVS